MKGFARRVVVAAALALAVACGRRTQERSSRPAASALPVRSASEAPRPVEPQRLITLDVSAYSTSLSLDDEAVYLLTPNAAYRLVPGQNPQGIELELGIGPVLTPSAFIFWSRGAIWRAPKTGGETRALAKLTH